MVVNGDSEDVASGLVDDTEAVAFAPLDIDDSPRNFRSALEATDTVDGTRVRDGHNTSGDVAIEKRKCAPLPPVTDLDDLRWPKLVSE